MSDKPYRQQAIALAGVFQAATLADSVATSGEYSTEVALPLLEAVMNLDPVSWDQVLPSPRAIEPGLRALIGALEGGQERQLIRPTGYALALLHLGNLLLRDAALANVLRNRLQALDAQRAHFPDITSVELNRRLAGIYVDTLGTLKFRIKVQGEPAHLRNEDNAARIRALFLAGVRCAILWHQGGGRRWKLLLNRSRVLGAAGELLSVLDTH